MSNKIRSTKGSSKIRKSGTMQAPKKGGTRAGKPDLLMPPLSRHVGRIFARWAARDQEQGELSRILVLSVSDGESRAKTMTFPAPQGDEAAWTAGLSRAVREHMDKAQEKFAAPLCWLRLEWVVKQERTDWATFSADLKNHKRNYFRSGIAFPGVKEPWLLLTEMELNANACLYVGGDAAEAQVNRGNLETYIKARHGSSQMPDFADASPVIVFETGGVFLDARTGELHDLCVAPNERGHRTMPALHPGNLQELIDLGSHYLASQIQNSGQYHYGHFPCFGRAIPTYNTLRHASSTYALVEGYEACRHHLSAPQANDETTSVISSRRATAESLAEMKKQIDRALRYLIANCLRTYDGDGGKRSYVIETEDNEIKLGANAVMILALTKYMAVFQDDANNVVFREIADKLANGIMALQQRDGSFVHILNADDLSVKERKRTIYYDGEAAFGLMRLYGMTREQKLLDCVVRAFEHFISNHHEQAHDHWLAYCSNELVKYLPEKKYFAFAVRNVNGYVDFIRERITTYPTLLELSMAFHNTLLLLDEHPDFRDVLDGFNVAEFYRALHIRANYLVNGFFFPEVAMFYKYPKTILHGFFIRHHAFRVRIDDVEHYLSGFVAYQKLMVKERYPNILKLNNKTSTQEEIYIFFNKSIEEALTGIESAVLKRCQLFEKNLGVNPIYLQSNYKVDYPITIKKLYHENKISKNFRYESLYNFYQTLCDNPVEPQALFLQENENDHTIIQDNKKIIKYFFYEDTKRVAFIQYYDDNNKVIRVDNYDIEGYLSRTVFFQADPKQVLTELYYRHDNSICICKYYSKDKDGKYSIARIYVFNKENHIEKTFFNEEQLVGFLLNVFLSQFNKTHCIYFIIDRNVKSVEYALTNYQVTPIVKIIPVTHSFHLRDTRNMHSELRQNRYYFKHLKKIPAIITLTEQQQNDIVNRFGDFGNVYCIPHHIDHFPKKVLFETREEYKVVAFGRLAPEKRFDKMINIFSKVVQKIPLATLDIYGRGSLKSTLITLISDLGLENNVKLYDFTSNVYEKLSKARLSLLTSLFEGFSLVILESLTAGCPVVSTDIHYGPASMIQNGYNGFLIDGENDKLFADKIVEVLSDPQINYQLSVNAYNSIHKFYPENIAKLWKDLFQKLS